MDIDEKQVDEMLTLYLENKRRITLLTKQNDEIRTELLELMDDLDTNEFATRIYDVNRTIRQRQHIGKSCVPTDVWNQYAMLTRYYALNVTER